MNRRNFLTRASTAGLLAGLGAVPARARIARGGAAKRNGRTPNILVIITDQNHAGYSKRSGYPLDVTPKMDRLAASGVDFSRAYCTMPACVPSRTSMLTGRWPTAHRVRMNLAPDNAFFSKDMYQVAHEQGYRTALIGKNHTYLKPEDLDFWHGYSHEGGYLSADASPQTRAYETWLKGLHFNFSEEPTPFPVETQIPYRIVSDAIDFMDRFGDEPFMLQVSIPEPHDPEQVPEPYWNMFPPDKVPGRCAGPEALPSLGYRARWLHELQQKAFPDTDRLWKRYVSNYLGALRMIDDQVGRLIESMRAKGLLDNTIIVRVSDHGDYVMQYGLARKGAGMPEALVRVPMFWSGPGIKPNAQLGHSAFVSIADMMPTFCEIMQAEIPVGVQGRSLLPLLRGEDYPREEFRSIISQVGVGGLYYEASDDQPLSLGISSKTDAYDELNRVTQSGSSKMVRMDDWKLIFDMMGYGQLYDLASDPCELDNKFGKPQYATEQARLMAELAMWTIRTEDSLPTGPQNSKYRTKWARPHNWYAPHRHGTAPIAYIP